MLDQTERLSERRRKAVPEGRRGDASSLAACCELMRLLERIDLPDYILNHAIRRQVRTTLYRLSEEEFRDFCEAYGKVLAYGHKGVDFWLNRQRGNTR